MKFANWIALKEGDAARSLDQSQSPSMRLVDTPISKAGFLRKPIPHKEYQPRNFDRYAFRPDESKVSQYVEKMSKMVRNEMPVCIEALAGYYGNDGIVRAFDDFLTDLGQQNIKF